MKSRTKTLLLISLMFILIISLSSCLDNSLEVAEKQYNEGKYDKAVDTLKEANKLEDKSGAYSLEGMSYMQMNDFEKAYESFSKAIEENPDIPENYLNRAIAGVKLGDSNMAEADFEESLAKIEKLNSEESKLLLIENFATFLFVNAKYERALEVLESAKSLSLEANSFYDIRYNALKALSKDEEASKDLKIGLEKYPDDANLNLLMAVNKMDRGEYKKSIEYLDKAKLAGKADVEYYKSISYRLMEDYDNALKSISEHLENNENGAEAYLQKGIILNELGKYKRAIKSLKKVLSIDSNFVEANYYIAISYEGLGEYEKSISYLKKVPKSSEVYEFSQEEITFIKEKLIKD